MQFTGKEDWYVNEKVFNPFLNPEKFKIPHA
jgi:hypothetical protein